MADPGHQQIPQDDLVEAFLSASRALIGVAVRSLSAPDEEVTLAQHRALVVLAARGDQRISELAARLGVNSSTATRQCARLERRGFITRTPADDDRRAVTISVTDSGRALVAAVTRARREAIGEILAQLPITNRAPLLEALQSFTEAAGEVPDQHWAIGWNS